MKIGIYVGSFNPVHKGHIKIVNHLIDKKYLDKIIVIPTKNYWDKNNLINLEHRIKMLEIFKTDNIIIDKELNQIEYTYQIMDILNKKYPNDELHLIIGADNIVDFDKWKNYQELLSYNLIIVNRDNIDIEYHLDKLNKKENFKIINDLEVIDISSTLIRGNLFNKYDINELIDERVYKYIIDNNLYRE